MRVRDTRLDGRWILGCVAVATALRLFHLGTQPLWIDEMISLQLATWATGAEFWRGLLIDIHGPFTSLLLHGWAQLGRSEAWLRLLYALPSIATIPLVARLGTDLVGPTAGRAAALVLALSPFHVWYAQEVRNYAWLVLWATAALVLFVRLWDGTGRRREWIGLAVLLALAVLTNFSAAFLLAALSVAVVLRRPFARPLMVGWLGVLAFVGLVFLPWFVDWYQRIGGDRIFVAGPQPMGVPLRGTSGFSPLELPFAIWAFTWGYSLGPPLRALHVDRSFATIVPYLPVLVLGVAAATIAGVAGVAEVVRRGRATLVGAILLVPLALSVFLAARGLKTFHPRYLTAVFPVYGIVLATGWARPGRVPRAAAALAAGLAALSLSQYYYDPAYAKEDARTAARIVREHEIPGDSVVVIYTFRPFQYYYAALEGQARLLHVHKRFLRTDAEMRAHVADAREGGGRVWLVLTRWWDVAPEADIRRIFDESLDERDSWEVPGVKVLLYEEKTA